MARRARPWRCRACSATNKVGTRRCSACLTARPKKRVGPNRLPRQPYEVYLELNGTENCFICDKPPGEKNNPDKKNHRDHDHKTGMPRGLLCFPCNSLLRSRLTLDKAKRIVLYLERAELIAASITNQNTQETTTDGPISTA